MPAPADEVATPNAEPAPVEEYTSRLLEAMGDEVERPDPPLPDPEIVIGKGPKIVKEVQETEPEQETVVVGTEVKFPPDTSAMFPFVHGVVVESPSHDITAVAVFQKRGKIAEIDVVPKVEEPPLPEADKVPPEKVRLEPIFTVPR